MITGATIVSMDPALGVIEGGDITVDGGKILAVGRAARDWAVTAIDGLDPDQGRSEGRLMHARAAAI